MTSDLGLRRRRGKETGDGSLKPVKGSLAPQRLLMIQHANRLAPAVHVNRASVRVNQPDLAEAVAQVEGDLLRNVVGGVVRRDDLNYQVGRDIDHALGY